MLHHETLKGNLMADNGTVVIVIRKEVEDQDKGKDLLDTIITRMADVPDLQTTASFANHYVIEEQ